MVYMIIVTIIEVAAVLVILRTGWLFQFLENIPFFDKVVNIVSGYFGQISGSVSEEVESNFLIEILKTIVFIIVFSVLTKFFSSMLDIGRREYVGGFRRIITKPFKIIAIRFFSAIATGIIVQLLGEYVFQIFQEHKSILIIVITLTIVASILIGYFLIGLSSVAYALWILGTAIFPGVVNLLAVEFIIVIAYYLFNVPGVFDQVGAIAMTCIGLICCVGSIFGADFFSDRCRERIERDDRYVPRHMR